PVGVEFGRQPRRCCPLSTNREYLVAVRQFLDRFLLVVAQDLRWPEGDVLRSGDAPRLVALRRTCIDECVVVRARVLLVCEFSGGDRLEHDFDCVYGIGVVKHSYDTPRGYSYWAINSIRLF